MIKFRSLFSLSAKGYHEALIVKIIRLRRWNVVVYLWWDRIAMTFEYGTLTSGRRYRAFEIPFLCVQAFEK